MLDIAEDIDIFTEQKIQIVRRVKDFSDIASKEAEFTRTFQGPASRKNQQALENYGILGTNSTFDPHKGIPCVWSFSTFAKFSGRLEVVSVTYKDGKPYSFTFNFYGRQRSLANVFGADRFSDIDWSAFDHALTYFNVISSWQGDLDGNNNLLYPLIDSRANYYFGPENQNIEGNIRNIINPILLTDLKPAIRLPAFLLAVFDAYGLVLEGDLITDVASDWDNAFILPNRWSGSGVSPDTFNNNGVSYNAVTNATITAANSDLIMTFATEIQDENSLWNDTTYTANVAGVHPVAVFGSISLLGTAAVGQYVISVRVNGIETNSFPIIRQATDPQIFTFNFPTLQLTLDDLDEIEFFLMRVDLVIGAVTFPGQDCRLLNGTLLIQSPTNQLGQTVSLGDQMPDDKIVEWLSAFTKSLNLVLVPNDDDETKWTIQSVRDYYADGVQRDWKGYIDIENMTFTKPRVYKEIVMGFTSTDAAIQRAFRDATGRNYGEVNIRPDVEFAENKLEIRNPATLTPPSLFRVVDAAGVPTGEFADVTIHKSINIEGNPVKEPWLLFYYNGIGATSFPFYIQNGISGPTPTALQIGIYPHISSSKVFDTQQSSVTWCYSLESALNGQVPTSTSYRRYWETELQVQYAKESRVLQKARVVLPTLQFYQYQLNDEIFLENNWWRIEEIAHDQDGKNATVTLMSSRKLLPDITRTVKPGGEITFDRAPNSLEKSAAGAYPKGANFYGSFVRAQITPNLAKYGQVINNITQTFIEEINEIDGRFRSWDDES